MFPQSEIIIRLSNQVVKRWHNAEQRIHSLDDALRLIRNKKLNDILYHVEMLSLLNTALWHEEDKARDTFASDSDIAGVKRRIDKLNAMRVNKTEEIDNILLNTNKINPDAPLNTETAGSIIDRIAILVLKKHHMKIEAKRKDSPEELRDKCKENLNMIDIQMKNIATAYDHFINEIESGKRRYTLYRQFKMYNDPNLNPVLYSKK